MIFKDKDIFVNIFVETMTPISKEGLEKFFPFEQKEENHDELYEGKYSWLIQRSNVSFAMFGDFLKELANEKDYFEITVDSDEEGIYERYSFSNENEYILRSYLPEEYVSKKGIEHLAGIIFHSKEEKIALENL